MGPASSGGGRCTLLLLCLALCCCLTACQKGIPPTGTVQPLYACSMDLEDLPQFTGSPTPEMLAGGIGLTLGLQGLTRGPPAAGSGAARDTQRAEPSVHPRRPPRPHRAPAAVAAPGEVAGKLLPQSLQQPQRSSRSIHADSVAAHGSRRQRAAVAAAPGASNWAGQLFVRGGVSSSSQAAAAAVPATASTHAAGRQQQQQPATTGRHLLQAGPAAAAEPAAVDGDSNEQVYLHSTDLFDAESLLDKQFCLNKGTSPLKHHHYATSSSAVQAGARPAAAAQGVPVAAAGANASAASLAAAAAAMDAVAGIADVSTAAKHKGRKTQAGASGWPSLPKLGRLFKQTTGAVKAGLAYGGGGDDDAGGDDSSYESPAEPPVYYQPEPLRAPPPHHGSYGGPARLSGFKPACGQEGLRLAESGNVPADATVAVGPINMLHVVNSLVKVVPLGSEDGQPDGAATVVGLPDFFSLVASNCDGGYITPSAAYDKQVGRFLLTAVCGGDANQILLAVSQGADAAGGWWLYSFPGYSTVDTPMECIDEGGVQANPFSIHTQVGYNRDGVFVSFVQNCHLEATPGATGAVLYALPKWALYSGATQNVIGPVFTAYDVLQAVGQYNDFDLEASSFRQLQPAMPQRQEDVQADLTYFVSDPLSSGMRNQLAVVALVNTGSLWQYTGEEDPAPLLVARVVGRGVDSAIDPSTLLQQPAAGDAQAPVGKQEGMCAPLDPGTAHPPGFWSGGAALYGNSIYLADRGPDLVSSSTPASMFPSVYWAVLSPSLCATGTCATFLGDDWGWEEGWDWGSCRWEDNGGSKEAHQWQRQQFFRVRAAKKPPYGYAAAAAAASPADSGSLAVAGGAAGPVTTAAAAAAMPALAAAAGAGRRLQAEVASVALAPSLALKPKPLSAAFKSAAVAAPAAALAAAPLAVALVAGNAAGATTPGALVAPVKAAVSGAMRSVASRPAPYQRRSPFLPSAAKLAGGYGDDDDDEYDEDDAFEEGADDDDDDDEAYPPPVAYGGSPGGSGYQRPYGQPPRPYAPPLRPYAPPKQQPYSQQHEEPSGAPPVDRVYYGAEEEEGPDRPPYDSHGGYGQPDHPPPAYGNSPTPKPSPSQSPPSNQSSPLPPRLSPPSLPPQPTMRWPSPPPPRSPRPYRPPPPPFSPPHEAPPRDGYDDEPDSMDDRLQPHPGKPSKPGGKDGKDGRHRQHNQHHGKDKGGKRLGGFTLAKPAPPTVWEVMMRACNRPAESSAPASHAEYYEAWRDHPGVRHVYAKLHLAPRFNPCKYYRDWHVDNRITFGVIVARRGVLDHATGANLAGNAVGLAFPQVVVRDGSALLVYSFSGPGGIPGATHLPAYPGIGYSIIPPGLAGGSAAFNLLKPGAGCVYQGPVPGREQQAWGSYSGADIHAPSLTAWTAVSYAQQKSTYSSIPSNAGTWLQAFVPAHVSQSYNPSYLTPAPNTGLPKPLPGQQQQQQRAGDAREHEEVSYVHDGPEQYEHKGDASSSSSSSGDFYDDSADQVQVLPHPIGLHGHSSHGRGYESWAHEGLEEDEEGGAWDEEVGSTTRAAASGSSVSMQRWAPEDADGTVAGKPTATAQPQAASSPSPASKPADDMLAKVRMWLSQAAQQQQQQQQQAPTSGSSSSTVSTQQTRVQQPGQGAALLQALANPLQQQQPGSSRQPAVHAHKQHGRQAGHSASPLMPGPHVGASADAAAAAAAAAGSSNQVASPGAQLPLVAQLSGALRPPAPHPDAGQQYFDDYEAHS